ncbi:MAG: hypothetical protein ACE15C_15115 [Phycisphaerae bacterium]
MSGMQTSPLGGPSAIAGMENQLALAVSRAVGEVARLETLDEEQRAEIYAILGTIQEDVRVHRAVADSLGLAPLSRADA